MFILNDMFGLSVQTEDTGILRPNSEQLKETNGIQHYTRRQYIPEVPYELIPIDKVWCVRCPVEVNLFSV